MQIVKSTLALKRLIILDRQVLWKES